MKYEACFVPFLSVGTNIKEIGITIAPFVTLITLNFIRGKSPNTIVPNTQSNYFSSGKYSYVNNVKQNESEIYLENNTKKRLQQLSFSDVLLSHRIFEVANIKDKIVHFIYCICTLFKI